MDDLISRQAVLDLLIRCAVPENGGSLLYQGIKQLPSAERRGKWVMNERGVYECSVCGRVPTQEQKQYDCYCPDCGAKMDEVEE